MTRLMYDSTNAAHIPVDAPIVGGYVNGPYRWSQAGWDRFPHAIKVGICTDPTVNAGVVGDCEPGAIWPPARLVAWVRMRRGAGIDPTGYCSKSNWDACRAAFAAANVPEPHWWIAAHPGGGAGIPAGAIGHQYADPATSGGHFDLSVVADYWPGVDAGANMAELNDIYDQLAGPGAPDGTYPGWPTRRYPPAPGSPAAFTVTDYVREIDREVNSRLDIGQRALAAGRPALDTLFGHATSAHAAAEQVVAMLSALAAEVAAIKAAVAALQPSHLTGSAQVTVNLTPGNTR